MGKPLIKEPEQKADTASQWRLCGLQFASEPGVREDATVWACIQTIKKGFKTFVFLLQLLHE